METPRKSRAGPKPHSPHVGEPVRVGEYTVFAGGTMYKEFFGWFDQPEGSVVFVPLTHGVPAELTAGHIVEPLILEDFGGVPSDWQEKLEQRILPRLAGGHKLLAYCVGSHGRTGTFLASLIALLETPEMTPDPIAAVRYRHCEKAVETLEQAEGIFALRGQPVPRRYHDEFARWGVG